VIELCVVLRIRDRMLNATFNNISVLLVEETGVAQWKPPTCRMSLINCTTQCCIEYTSPLSGFDLTTLVVIGTDCTGSCKSNFRMITTTTTPLSYYVGWQIKWCVRSVIEKKYYIYFFSITLRTNGWHLW
jgi:hypothetical protein